MVSFKVGDRVRLTKYIDYGIDEDVICQGIKNKITGIIMRVNNREIDGVAYQSLRIDWGLEDRLSDYVYRDVMVSLVYQKLTYGEL